MNKYLLTFLIPTLGLAACVSSGSSSPNTATPEPPKSGSVPQQPKSNSATSKTTPTKPTPAKPTRDPNSLGVKASDPVTALLKAELEIPTGHGILDQSSGAPISTAITSLEDLAHKKFNVTDPSTGEVTHYFQIKDGGLLRTRKNIDNTQTLVTELFYLQPDSYYMAAILQSGTYSESSYDGTKVDFNTLPQSGTSTYTGSAVSAKADGSGFVTGKLDMEVNWGSKQVTSGTITITDGSNNRNITLQQGTISVESAYFKNKYEGEAIENGTNGSYEGSFFGNDAGETAGLVTFKPKSNLASVSPSPTGKKDVAFGGRKSK